MLKIPVWITSTTLLLSTAGALTIPRGQEDLSVDNVEATDLKGKAFRGTALRGKVVLADFWASWCTPCVKAFPVLKQVNADYKDQGFQVLGIAVYSGTIEDVEKVVDKHGLDYTVVIGDEDLIETFGVIGVPTYFLFGRDGHLARKYVGQSKDFHERVQAHIRELLEK
ncbi:MAG: TlpA disulfide reductase family protein [Candidatus Neomarinimicrobiota bacterium]